MFDIQETKNPNSLALVIYSHVYYKTTTDILIRNEKEEDIFRKNLP